MAESSPPAKPAWSDAELTADPHRHDEKADRVRSMFGAIANSYDRNNRLHSFWLDQRWRKAVVRESAVTASDRVLDVACGTGDLTECFCRAKPAEVIGVDFTPEMLAVAGRKGDDRRRAAGEPTPTYTQGDAMDLSFPDARFDVLSIAFGIRNVAEPARALREFRRVLAPGGRLAILEFATPRNPFVRVGHDLYTKRIMPWTATLIARDRSGAYRYLPRSVATFLEPPVLAEAVRDAGFDDVRQRFLTFGTCCITLATVAG